MKTVTVPLEGRLARCPYCKVTVKSKFDLAFFEYRGEESRGAVEQCKHCRYHEVAHRPRADDEFKPKGYKFSMPKFYNESNETVDCPGFEPHGAFEFDSFYDGCRGWD